MNKKILKYIDGEIIVNAQYENDSLCLNIEEIANLFDTSILSIKKIVRNLLNEEERDSYNLDFILSIGYHLNSERGIKFKNWANSILNKYILDGYVINKKRLIVLDKTIEVQNKIINSSLDKETKELIEVINYYNNAFQMLDDYDHQCLKKPMGNKSIYQLSYEECRNYIDSMKYGKFSSIFGVEKEKGKLNGILSSIHQTAFGEDVYKSIEEKAANLLYFIIKDHPFVDGCKRIAVSLFLMFLHKNNQLIKDGKYNLTNGTLVAMTLLIAESKPDEKEIMINIIMNILFNKN